MNMNWFTISQHPFHLKTIFPKTPYKSGPSRLVGWLVGLLVGWLADPNGTDPLGHRFVGDGGIRILMDTLLNHTG